MAALVKCLEIFWVLNSIGSIKACNAIMSSDKLMLDLWLTGGPCLLKTGGGQYLSGSSIGKGS
jgi:hypothetical protein